jgi:hypothetical protein
MTMDGNAMGIADFKDRKTGLVVFGIIEIMFGVFFALMVPLMLLSLLVTTAQNGSSAPPPHGSMMVPSLLFYVLLAVWFIWMGIGSVMARRWARALLLVTSWLWLISGIMGMVFIVLLLPNMYDQMGHSGQMPREVVTIVKYVTIGFTGIFYVIIPAGLVLFYGSKHVKATCERRDPRIRWTDRCPLPVLGLSLVAGLWAACMLLLGFLGWAIPFFGTIQSGMAGAGVALLAMVLLGYVAYGAYRLNIKAWWCAVLLIIAWGLSAGLTFSRLSLMDYYEKMNFPSEQLELMKPYTEAQQPWIVLFSVLWVAPALVYVLYTRRYFTRPASAPNPSFDG